MNTRTEVMDTTKICSNFPPTPQQEILRESLIDTINQLFEKHSLVIVEGPNGIGKTTLLAQFAKQRPDTSVSIFLTPATKSSYDPEAIRIDLLSQVWWILSHKEIDSEELGKIDISSQWGMNRIKLQKKAKSHHQVYYFILDGVCDIPDNHASYRDLILDLLPLGFNNEFKFLISGDSAIIPEQIINQVPTKTLPMSPYTLDEAYKNLVDLEFSIDEITEIYKIFKHPGQFASIRRSIQAGQSKEALISNLPNKMINLLELEWRSIDFSNNLLIKSIAAIAYSSLELSIEDVAKIVGSNFSEVKKILSPIQFLQINDGNIVVFVSESQLNLAQTKLNDYKDEAENRIIDFLRNSEDPMATVYLPAIYEKTKKYVELLDYLTPEVLIRILKLNQSLIPLLETTMVGVNAANKINRDDHLVGLGLQAAIIKELFASDIWESEIIALISIKETQLALSLIERAATKEDQLLLLSVLANAKVKYQLDIQGLEERIENAYKQMDHTKLGDKAINIASNLINFLPDLAFNIIENNTDRDQGDDALDWAYTQLSLRTLGNTNQDVKSYDIVEKIYDKIKDPAAKNFLNTGSLLVWDFPGSKIISEAKKIEQASEQLFLIRSWATRNREAPDVSDVLEFGLQIAITTNDYSPNARDFRELSTPLPHIQNIETRKQLINKIDGQISTIERLGPIEDYVRILVLLGMAEKDLDIDACRNRFIEAYLYSTDLEDLSTKSSCLARISSALSIVDPEEGFENKDKLHTLVNKDLESSIENLLDKTAEQYVVTKSIIRALSKHRTEYAYNIVEKLNREERRNQASYDLAIELLEVPDNKLDFTFIEKCLTNISHKSLHDDLLIQILTRTKSIHDKEVLNQGIILHLISFAKDIHAAADRCQASCACLTILEQTGTKNHEELNNSLTELLFTSWNDIDIGWLRVDIGFKIVEALSDFTDLAHKFLKMVEDYRSGLCLDSDGTAKTYLYCSRLLIRAYSGLLNQKIDGKHDLMRLKTAIDNVPSTTHRIGLYTELALKSKGAGRSEDFTKIVQEEIKPLIDNIPDGDQLALQSSIIASAPALYLHHSISTLNRIKGIKDLKTRDQAYSSICSYILTKLYRDPSYNPASQQGEKLSYDEVMDIINIIKEIDSDAIIFGLISEIAGSINTYRINFNKNQKADIARSLENIINEKLPNPKYIKHDGYKLVSLAQVYRIRETKPAEWNELIDRVKSINIADQVLILSSIAECLPRRSRELRIKLISDAESLIKDIPSVYDQIDRYEILSQAAISDLPMSQKFLKAGMEIIIKHDDPNLLSSQRRYIDLAYKIDPGFAATLASMVDDDPARMRTRLNIQKRLSQLKLKQKISSPENPMSQQNDPEERDYPATAWIMLGSLNSRRLAPMRFDDLREYSITGANLPISESYPIFAWLIQNSILKYQDTPQASKYIRPLFEAALTSCQLIISIAKKSTSQIKNVKSFTDEEVRNSIVVADTDPHEAKSLLTKWLKNNLGDELLIADPYFGLDELWILQEINGINPSCRIYILTSREHNKDLVSPENSYIEHWRLNVSDQEPPYTEVVIAETEMSKQSPIHDRWWISGIKGLRIGTSVSGLGGRRISEIGDLSLSETEEREEIIKRFVIRKERIYQGEKIRYLTFTL